jgi:2,5-diamino-6-(ribosylamino)-4(3H)-pyrimidinone 5'-phosphate reductase
MRPHISLNLALSADGKISDPISRPSGWTSHLDHSRLLQLRHGADGLLVGRRTWLADQMTMRVPDSSRQPLRCIVTSNGDLDPLHPLFHTPGGDIHVLCTESLPSLPHPENIQFHSGSLDSFLTTLHEAHHVRTLHCEGGGFLVRELLRIHAVDTIYLTVAGHILFGGQNAPTLSGIPNAEFLSPANRFTLEAFEPHTSTAECFLTYRRNPQ